MRPETGSLTLVGLEDGNPLGESPEGETDHALPSFIDRAIARICQRVPGMEHGALHSAHGGRDGITPDQRPILDQAGPEGFYLQCGFSGTGFKIAPAVGACMAELILDGRANTVDIRSSPSGLRRGPGATRRAPLRRHLAVAAREVRSAVSAGRRARLLRPGGR